MKLFEVCEIGRECGLTTLKEALENIQFHAANLFSYKEINNELHELYEEIRNYSPKMLIEDYLNGKTSN